MILNRFFNKPKPAAVTYPVELSSGQANFTPWSGDAYANDIYRAAVDAIARNAGKLKGTYFVINGSVREPAAGKLNRLLQVQPNPYMNAYDLIYKVVTQYFLHNNGFIYIQREKTVVTGFYPLTPNRIEFVADGSGTLFCRFWFNGGNTVILPYSDIIHIRRNFNKNDLLGDDNTALYPALELAHTQNEGIVNGIKAGANIRGILHFTQIMAPELLKKEKERFINDYLAMSNDGGVVATDQKTEYTPIDSKSVAIDAEQLNATKIKIYDYLGVSEKIVSSSYNENEWAAFYESTIEPIAVQLGLEFTRKIFTEREQSFGNQIIFESSRLQFASNQTKVNLIKELMPYGILSINQALEILNLPAVEGGDRHLQTLNVIDASKANEYQTGKDTEEDKT